MSVETHHTNMFKCSTSGLFVPSVKTAALARCRCAAQPHICTALVATAVKAVTALWLRRSKLHPQILALYHRYWLCTTDTGSVPKILALYQNSAIRTETGTESYRPQ